MFDGIERALVVAAHPDDEVLGCGATVARLAKARVDVRTLILATGSLSREDGSSDAVAALESATRAAAATLGSSDVTFAGLPDNAMDSIPLLRVVRPIETLVGSFRPQLVLTHHAGDLNIDHRIAHEATLTACRPLPGCPIRAILAFETVSSTEWGSQSRPAFRPDLYVECGPMLDAKLSALAHYDAEMRSSPHARSFDQIRDLAAVRGRESGFGPAEAFTFVRANIPA
jgi:LmbE family N-acetylglucosaminyl deacetylase